MLVGVMGVHGNAKDCQRVKAVSCRLESRGEYLRVFKSAGECQGVL